MSGATTAAKSGRLSQLPVHVTGLTLASQSPAGHAADTLSSSTSETLWRAKPSSSAGSVPAFTSRQAAQSFLRERWAHVARHILVAVDEWTSADEVPEVAAADVKGFASTWPSLTQEQNRSPTALVDIVEGAPGTGLPTARTRNAVLLWHVRELEDALLATVEVSRKLSVGFHHGLGEAPPAGGGATAASTSRAKSSAALARRTRTAQTSGLRPAEAAPPCDGVEGDGGSELGGGGGSGAGHDPGLAYLFSPVLLLESVLPLLRRFLVAVMDGEEVHVEPAQAAVPGPSAPPPVFGRLLAHVPFILAIQSSNSPGVSGFTPCGRGGAASSDRRWASIPSSLATCFMCLLECCCLPLVYLTGDDYKVAPLAVRKVIQVLSLVFEPQPWEAPGFTTITNTSVTTRRAVAPGATPRRLMATLQRVRSAASNALRRLLVEYSKIRSQETSRGAARPPQSRWDTTTLPHTLRSLPTSLPDFSFFHVFVRRIEALFVSFVGPSVATVVLPATPSSSSSSSSPPLLPDGLDGAARSLVSSVLMVAGEECAGGSMDSPATRQAQAIASICESKVELLSLLGCVRVALHACYHHSAWHYAEMLVAMGLPPLLSRLLLFFFLSDADTADPIGIPERTAPCVDSSRCGGAADPREGWRHPSRPAAMAMLLYGTESYWFRSMVAEMLWDLMRMAPKATLASLKSSPSNAVPLAMVPESDAERMLQQMPAIEALYETLLLSTLVFGCQEKERHLRNDLMVLCQCIIRQWVAESPESGAAGDGEPFAANEVLHRLTDFILFVSCGRELSWKTVEVASVVPQLARVLQRKHRPQASDEGGELPHFGGGASSSSKIVPEEGSATLPPGSEGVRAVVHPYGHLRVLRRPVSLVIPLAALHRNVLTASVVDAEFKQWGWSILAAMCIAEDRDEQRRPQPQALCTVSSAAASSRPSGTPLAPTGEGDGGVMRATSVETPLLGFASRLFRAGLLNVLLAYVSVDSYSPAITQYSHQQLLQLQQHALETMLEFFSCTAGHSGPSGTELPSRVSLLATEYLVSHSQAPELLLQFLAHCSASPPSAETVPDVATESRLVTHSYYFLRRAATDLLRCLALHSAFAPRVAEALVRNPVTVEMLVQEVCRVCGHGTSHDMAAPNTSRGASPEPLESGPRVLDEDFVIAALLILTQLSTMPHLPENDVAAVAEQRDAVRRVQALFLAHNGIAVLLRLIKFILHGRRDEDTAHLATYAAALTTASTAPATTMHLMTLSVAPRMSGPRLEAAGDALTTGGSATATSPGRSTRRSRNWRTTFMADGDDQPLRGPVTTHGEEEGHHSMLSLGGADAPATLRPHSRLGDSTRREGLVPPLGTSASRHSGRASGGSGSYHSPTLRELVLPTALLALRSLVLGNHDCEAAFIYNDGVYLLLYGIAKESHARQGKGGVDVQAVTTSAEQDNFASFALSFLADLMDTQAVVAHDGRGGEALPDQDTIERIRTANLAREQFLLWKMQAAPCPMGSLALGGVTQTPMVAESGFGLSSNRVTGNGTGGFVGSSILGKGIESRVSHGLAAAAADSGVQEPSAPLTATRLLIQLWIAEEGHAGAAGSAHRRPQGEPPHVAPTADPAAQVASNCAFPKILFKLYALFRAVGLDIFFARPAAPPASIVGGAATEKHASSLVAASFDSAPPAGATLTGPQAFYRPCGSAIAAGLSVNEVPGPSDATVPRPLLIADSFKDTADECPRAPVGGEDEALSSWHLPDASTDWEAVLYDAAVRSGSLALTPLEHAALTRIEAFPSLCVDALWRRLAEEFGPVDTAATAGYGDEVPSADSEMPTTTPEAHAAAAVPADQSYLSQALAVAEERGEVLRSIQDECTAWEAEQEAAAYDAFCNRTTKQLRFQSYLGVGFSGSNRVVRVVKEWRAPQEREVGQRTMCVVTKPGAVNPSLFASLTRRPETTSHPLARLSSGDASSDDDSAGDRGGFGFATEPTPPPVVRVKRSSATRAQGRGHPRRRDLQSSVFPQLVDAPAMADAAVDSAQLAGGRESLRGSTTAPLTNVAQRHSTITVLPQLVSAIRGAQVNPQDRLDGRSAPKSHVPSHTPPDMNVWLLRDGVQRSPQPQTVGSPSGGSVDNFSCSAASPNLHVGRRHKAPWNSSRTDRGGAHRPYSASLDGTAALLSASCSSVTSRCTPTAAAATVPAPTAPRSIGAQAAAKGKKVPLTTGKAGTARHIGNNTLYKNAAK